MTDPLSPSQIAELRERRFELSVLERELLATVEAQAAVIERLRDGWRSAQFEGRAWWTKYDPRTGDGVRHNGVPAMPDEPMSPAEQVVVYGEVVRSEERSG